MPINEDNIEEEQEEIIFNLNDIEVNEHVEVIPVTEVNEGQEVRYALDDYAEVSTNNKQTIKVEEVIDQEIVFEKKIIAQEQEVEAPEEDLDPMNSSISDILKERADDRRQKMKSFNHKFNASKIDDIEKIPAYKRQGLNLDETVHSSSEINVSKTTLSIDDNDDIQLRNNNSFLHDNVD